jgi:hypothetical protein
VIALAARSSSSASSPSPSSPSPPLPFFKAPVEGGINDPRSSFTDPGPFNSGLLKSVSRRDVKEVVEEVVEDFAFSFNASLLNLTRSFLFFFFSPLFLFLLYE